jgi:hypothetical protein
VSACLDTHFLRMVASTELNALASTLSRLPPATRGEFQDGDRLLRLSRPKNGIELELQLLRMPDDPLLHAVIEMPAGTAQKPICKSKRSSTDSSFRERELRYLDAMIIWAQRVLDREPAPELRVRKKNPPWRKHIRALIAAATLGAVAPAHRFFEEFSDALEDHQDDVRAHEALHFLRDEGVVIHLDWKEEGQLILLARETAKRKGMALVRNALQLCLEGGSIDEEMSKLVSALGPAGFALVNIDDDSDSYLFLIAPITRAQAAVQALAALGVGAQICD